MKRRSLLCALALFVGGWGMIGTAAAAAISYFGQLNEGQPTSFRIADTCIVSAEFTWFHRQAFSVDTTGTYTMSISNVAGVTTDTVFALYRSAFNPAIPDANCETSNDDGGPGSDPLIETTLEAGKTYVLTTSLFGAGTSPGESTTFTATVSGPGTISLFGDLATDIDGNGTVDALTDGLMLLRWQFGLRGASLIAGAIGPGATRTTAAQVEAWLAQLERHSGPTVLVETERVGNQQQAGPTFVRDCAPGSAAVSLDVRQSIFQSPVLGQITITCAPILAGALGGLIVGSPMVALTSIGLGSGTLATLSCPAGWVIAGVQGSTKPVFSGMGTAVENLSLQCAPLGPGAMVVVGPAGAGATTPFVLPCPAGTMVRGMTGQAEELIDRLGLRCK